MTALIGALRVSLSAETAQFEAGMKRAQRTAYQTNSAFKKSFGGLGGIVKAGFAGVVSGVSIGLIAQGVKAALDYAGSLGEISQQLGVTTRDLQVFRYAAGQAGISQEEMEQGLGRLTKAMGQAQAGSKTMIAAFNAIGISVDDIRNKDAGEVFRLMADGLAKIPNAADRAAVEVAIFGRAGQKLDTLLAGGSAAINELAQAADELGIVLSDEQIQNADKTADKLEAVKTVLAAQVAGVVADNADAILDLANALARVAAVAVQASANFGNFIALVSRNIGFLTNPTAAIGKGGLQSSGNVKGFNKAGRSVTIDLAPTKAKTSTPTGGNVSQFLAGGGGSKKGRSGGSDDAERKRQEALRAAYQFDQEILRAQQDVLRAQQQLSTDYSERAALSIQMLNLEQQGFQREMEYAVASGELSKAQAAQLEAEFAKRDALERQAVLAEEEAQRYEDYNRLDQLDFDLQRDILESQLQLARTAKQQRDIRLKILELDYRAERARLETVLADEKASYAAKEEARRRLDALNKTEGNDRAAVAQGSQDPLQAYFDRIPKNAEEMNEALNGVVANGLQNLEDGLVGILTGTEKVGDAFRKMAQEIIAQLIRIQVQQFILKIAQGLGVPQAGGMAQGGPVGFAAGGWVSGRGTGTSDSIPAMLSNGEFVVNAKSAKRFMPLLEQINAGDMMRFVRGGMVVPGAYRHSERVSVSNGAERGGSSISIPITIMGNATRETAMQVGAKARAAIASANRKGA